jgi:hypothetical protein
VVNESVRRDCKMFSFFGRCVQHVRLVVGGNDGCLYVRLDGKCGGVCKTVVRSRHKLSRIKLCFMRIELPFNYYVSHQSDFISVSCASVGFLGCRTSSREPLLSLTVLIFSASLSSPCVFDPSFKNSKPSVSSPSTNF